MHDDRYHQLYMQSPLAILTVDQAGQIVACNPALSELLMRGSAELIATPILKWVRADERKKAREFFMRSLEGLQGELNTTLRCGDGAQRNVGIRTVPQPVGDSVRLDVFVSERGVERPIRAADVAVLDLLSNLPGVYALVLDADLRVRHARGMTRTHWCRDDEVIGRELVSLLEATDDNAQQLAALRREITSDAPWAGLLRPLRADGSGFPAHVFAMVRQHATTREPIGYVLAGREANEEVELRSQLHRARRMATIGEVATSVAREVSAGLVAARSVLDADIPRIGDARDALTHLQRMTQTLLSFSSDVSVDRRQNAIPRLVETVVADLQEEVAAAGATVTLELAEDLPELVVDGGHVREVLRQVLCNAIDAVASAERRTIRIEGRHEGCAVTVRVHDSGPGMDPGIAARAFDPFFTTRTHRFGLGLAIARGIATAHGGRLFAETGGAGTTIVLELPDGATGARIAFRAAPLILGRERTVLLVDDDAALRRLFRRVLEKVGYQAREAWSGRSALAELSNGATPDFLVTDLRMAGGNGSWLLRQIGRDFPTLLKRTVIVTGEQADTQVDRIAADTGCPVLRKPLDPKMLLEVLDTLALRSAEQDAKAATHP